MLQAPRCGSERWRRYQRPRPRRSSCLLPTTRSSLSPLTAGTNFRKDLTTTSPILKRLSLWYANPSFMYLRPQPLPKMAMRQRNKDPERWLLQKRNGQGPSAATSAMLKGEPTEGSIRGGSGQSLGPGGRRLRAVVNSSARLFGDDDDDGQSRSRDLGQDADYDEVPYHEDFADDEEKVLPEDHQEDELEKEMEVRTV